MPQRADTTLSIVFSTLGTGSKLYLVLEGLVRVASFLSLSLRVLADVLVFGLAIATNPRSLICKLRESLVEIVRDSWLFKRFDYRCVLRKDSRGISNIQIYSAQIKVNATS